MTGSRIGQPKNRDLFPDRSKNIFFYKPSFLVPIQPPVKWVTWALFPGRKGAGREADQSSPSIDHVKNAWSYTFAFSYTFMACKERTLHIHLCMCPHDISSEISGYLGRVVLGSARFTTPGFIFMSHAKHLLFFKSWHVMQCRLHAFLNRLVK